MATYQEGERAVLTLQKRNDLRGRERQRRIVRRNRQIAQELARAEALERLIALLETGTPEAGLGISQRRRDSRSHLARLEAAHATYALANSSEMERISDGAWIRRR
jgi:hypothetical protein